MRISLSLHSWRTQCYDQSVRNCNSHPMVLFLLLISCRHLDVPLLVAWLSARQHAPEGGFAGRTNKLVDGCYSHWVGGCWPLLEAALNGPQSVSKPLKPTTKGLYSREGLIRYILCCCQATRGGLRDKPSKYVTCTTLNLNVLLLTRSGIQTRIILAISWLGLVRHSITITSRAKTTPNQLDRCPQLSGGPIRKQ